VPYPSAQASSEPFLDYPCVADSRATLARHPQFRQIERLFCERFVVVQASKQVSAAHEQQDSVSPAPPLRLLRQHRRPCNESGNENDGSGGSGFERFTAEDIKGLTATIACLDFGTEPAIDGQPDGLTGDAPAEARAATFGETATTSERAHEASEQQLQSEAASSASLGVVSVHDAHDVSAGAAHAQRVPASNDGGVRSVPRHLV